MAQITYENKVKINDNPSIPDINKVTDDDMNEIKEVVNTNYSEQQTIQNQLEDSTNYSAEETIIGTWIDGKPIYRKVLNCGALPNNSDKLIDVNVSNINNVINIYGIGISSSGTCFPLPYVYNNFNAQIELVYLASSQQIRITTGQDRSGINGYVTIEYTKTTD